MRLFQTLRWPVVPRLKQCHPAVCSVPTPHSAPLQVRLAEPGGLCGGGATPSPDSRRGAPDGNSLTLSTAQLHSPPQPRVWPSPSTAWYCSAHWLQRAPPPPPPGIKHVPSAVRAPANPFLIRTLDSPRARLTATPRLGGAEQQ